MNPLDLFLLTLMWALFGGLSLLLAVTFISMCVIMIIWAYQLVRDLTRP